MILGYYWHRDIAGTGVVYHDGFEVARAEALLGTGAHVDPHAGRLR